VPHQVLDRDWTIGGTSSSLLRSLPPSGSMPTFTSANAGMYFDSGSCGDQFAVSDQHHRGGVGDGLGHRAQREHRVQAHRRLGRDVAIAEGLQIDRLAVLLDQDDRAGNATARDLGVEELGNAFEFSRRRGRDVGATRGGPM
jgi:hypothetical protein